MASWGGPRVTRLRRRMIEELPLQCWRCGGWITSSADLTIGHVIGVDEAPHLMWEPDNLRPEHARRTGNCPGNFSAGATYGNRKRVRTPTSRAW